MAPTPKQPSLFGEEQTSTCQEIPLDNGRLLYWPNWLSQQQHTDINNTSELFKTLQEQVNWDQSDILIYGKRMKIPRLNAWYGERGFGYVYSGTYFEPQPWLPQLLMIKQQLERDMAAHLPCRAFNSALVNCYRDGADSVAWHSDDEPELGKNPQVASVSLGESRCFQLRHRYNKQQKFQLDLHDGDLLLMTGSTQHYWHHQIPKTKHKVGPRINITYRYIEYPH